MIIGYEAKRIFRNFTGLGNYARDLVSSIQAQSPESQLHLFTPSTGDQPRVQPFTRKPYHLALPTGSWGPAWRSFGIAPQAQKLGVQVFHGLSNELPFDLEKHGIRSVVTIHDLIFRHYSDQYPWLDRKIYDFKFSSACRRADKVVAISEATKEDLIDMYQVPAEKIQVIYQTCHDQFWTTCPAESLAAIRAKYQLPKTFCLYVGSIIPRKNLLRIVEAWHVMKPENRPVLVAIGGGKDYKESVEKYIRVHRLGKWIKIMDPDFADFPALYQAASLFLYPALMEGFGIPVLEALVSGTPVITSNRSSLMEAGGPGSWHVDPTNREEIAQAVHHILGNQSLQDQMIQQGLQYAERFRKQDLAAQWIELYGGLIAGH
ncbi:glycosyltransferase family 1 protein [Pontibacter sp. G13]|uniref:glycosyltransferase family 4 protein n=1 Tax=Pontibacter sp. G13 TaxID=3074898 RepID=UPI00288B7C9D|nr:glycosyltransferase family 1 protein [Pontibacter sp. G13]WNJ21450.1 glycosyltransferase family 1 protein [Pontibacter sp. G13]